MSEIALKIVDRSGQEAGVLNGNPDLWAQEIRSDIIHLAVVAELDAHRRGTRKTKTRSEVSGGGAKPWRQKGTGRARAGTTRAPHWRHGGVAFAFGPDRRQVKINRKLKKKALAIALSDRLAEGDLIIVDHLSLEAPRTKEALALLQSLGIPEALLVTDGLEANLVLGCRNLHKVDVVDVASLSVYDILSRPKTVITQAAVKKLEERFQ
ncbi:MAG: 50S ribosomal protein L4 [Alphaproteobacteria bacterium CG_4_10_14_0_2_um_filter_63_37]|nr:MAG: 50S ribosomal protein L4 [Proteobacteria bacterium CG1_02_64_396]PJA25553.1 MAG: 50S ribosomal protein L4 [Alphaproteobacteria bacterium CG_4_10_14_0_2_um_filter_63_37]